MIVGVVGDRRPGHDTHDATDAAIAHAGGADVCWLPTPSLLDGLPSDIDAVFVAPGSPYESLDGALAAIRDARERDLPLLGTCGGFQHVAVEFVRNVLGVADAGHAEYASNHELAVTPLECSLAGETHDVVLRAGTRAREIYGTERVSEPYRCSFGLNPAYRVRLEDAGMVFSGHDDDGEPRVLELPSHRFFLATLYVPQVASEPGCPHPLVVRWLLSVR